ncbi:EF-hand domain-containing protein [Microseira sp. BLCC-F43]|uniref:EF-hand domain-containing protein n=1 Tax=Microseira sp. BLCC-F43 TaxID=3153602 RepID=UPI0035BB1F67
MNQRILKLKKTFEIFDRDGNGTISIKELKQVIQAIGQNVTQTQLQEIIAEIDINRDGEIDFEEFCSSGIVSQDNQSPERDLMQVFQKFDKNGDGYIDVQEMSSEAMSILNTTLSDQEIMEMFRIADSDGNGKLDYDEFVKVIMAKSAEMASSAVAISSNLDGFKFVHEIPEASWNFVEQLQQKAYSHQAFNHPYLQRLAEGNLPDIVGAIKDYAVQYCQYSNKFKNYLNLVINQIENLEHKQLMIDNYQEENGDLDKRHVRQLADLGIDLEWVENVPHTVLFKRFQNGLGVTETDLQQVCPEALQFRERMQEICSKDVASAIAAIGLGAELGVKQMYSYILEAIKRYTPLAPREYVFFTLHTQMDEEHSHALKAIAADLASTNERKEQLSQGMEMALAARNSFWDALLERALKMPEKNNQFISPAQLYETSSQKWVRKEPSCLSDFTARPAIFELCEPVKDAVILDLGCGEGYCARELMRRGASKVIGVDISANSIAAAQAEEQREPLGITYLTGNSTNVLELLRNGNLLTDQEGCFDVIVAVFLFNYLTLHEMLQCMTQVQQLLKPGGRFIFSVPHPSFAFWSNPQTSFHFDVQGLAGVEDNSRGYFSARDRLLPGKIARRDGTQLQVQLRHKTMQDYFDALRKSGFETLPTMQELRVTDEHMQLDRAFFGSLYDLPLHVAFSIEKQAFQQPKRLGKKEKAIIKDIIWSRIFSEEDYCFQFPSEVLEEFYQAHRHLQANHITWENYQIGDAGELPNLQAFAHKMRDCCYDTTGFVLIQGLPLEEFGDSYEEREATAKLLYYMMSAEIGIISERRGRLFDVRDRNLNVADDNVLFSVTREASGWHTDSNDKDFNPDIVGLLCLQDGAAGGVLQNTNALNVYYRLKQILPQSIFAELEKPIIRDLIEKGFGKDSGNTWEQLRRSSALNLQKHRLRKNRFPIFSREPYTNEFSCRYMRYWIESGHKKAEVPLSPLLKIAMNGLDDVINNDPTIYRVERKLRPGEIIYTNNHICLHNRSAYEDRSNQPKRHMVRVWIDFNPTT